MAQLQGDSIRIAREYMDSLLVESRIVGAVRRVGILGVIVRTF